MSPNETSTPSPVVLDTNVFLDIHSCHDINRKYFELGVEGIDEPGAVYRRARARESILLAAYLNKIGGVTHSLSNEAIDRLTELVPPDAEETPETQPEKHFTTNFIHFVKDFVLPNWRPSIVAPKDEKPTGNAADAWLVAYAKEQGFPLVTNEGFKPTGYVEGKIVKRAREAGVEVFTPRDFYEGKMDVESEIDAFLQRFRDGAREYLRGRTDKTYLVLQWMEGALQARLAWGDGGPRDAGTGYGVTVHQGDRRSRK